MYRDIHRVVLEPVLCCLGWVLQDIVQSEVLVFSQCLFLLSWIQVSTNPDHSPSPICGKTPEKNSNKVRSWSSAGGWGGGPCPTDCSVWPGESSGSSELLVLWNLFKAVCHRSLTSGGLSPALLAWFFPSYVLSTLAPYNGEYLFKSRVNSNKKPLQL